METANRATSENRATPEELLEDIGELCKQIHQMKLTEPETYILKLTKKLWDEYIALTPVHPDENEELRRAIHQIQCLVARRVARRVDPEVWV